MVQQLAQALHRVQQLARPIRHREVASLAVQQQARFAAASRHPQVIGIQRVLLAARDRFAGAQQAQRDEGFEKSQLVLIDAHRVECADVQGADFHVFHAGALQCLRRPLPRSRDAFRPDEAVVLVLDLQDIGVELQIFAVHLDADLLVRWVGRADRTRQIAHIIVQAVHGNTHRRLILVPIPDVAHAQRGPVRLVHRVIVERRQDDFAARKEALRHRGRGAEQIQYQPAVAAVVSQHRVILLGNEILARLVGFFDGQEHVPQAWRERVIEMHAGNGLHDAAVAHSKAMPVNGLHSPDIRAAELRQRNAGIALEGAGHAGRPQQFLAQMPVHELMDVAQVLQQLPCFAERRGHQLDQRFGIVGSDVLVGERRSQ